MIRPEEIKTFINIVAEMTNNGVKILVDSPASDDGEWWIDLIHYSLEFETTVSWRRDLGFGIYELEEFDSNFYGENPFDFEHDPKLAANKALADIIKSNV